MPRNPDEIGALWVKTSKKTGKKYLAGKINGQRVVVFKNENKKEDKHPDYRVLLSKPQAEHHEEREPGDDFGT